MPSSSPSYARFWRGDIALALLVVGVITAGLVLLRDRLSISLIALLYLLPVGLSTAQWGLAAGVAAALGAFFAFNFFFIAPYYSLSVHQAQDLLVLVVFLGVAIFVSQIVVRARASLAAAQAREREALQLYELSATLARLRTRDEIGQALAQRLHEAIQAALTEVALRADGQQPERLVRLPPEAPPAATAPHFVVPILSGRGDLGEVRVWRVTPPPAESDKRLLRAFTSQGALALERAALEQAELRSKVLEEGDRLKSALLSSVSHELRTPLASIKAAVTSLASGEVDWSSRARADLLKMVEEETDHLNRLVGNLLDMSRIEAGAVEPQRQWNLLGDILGGTLNRLRRTTGRRQFVVQIPDDLPLVPVDSALLDQVFANLIGNSLKYAPPDTPITVTAWQPDEATVQVQVRNQGPHVPSEQLERIFDRFYRVYASERVTGTGLGLSICKGFIEAHGGRIWAENLPDGFAFTFTLPLAWDGHRPPQVPPDADL